MSIEEKAKAYDEALERARTFSLDSSNEEREKFIITSIFPKLTESEDEKTRKSLVKMISDISGDWQFEKYGIIKKDVIAWLEKQKEHISNIDAICLSAEIQKPYKDGNQWCILKGDNIQEGIVGFGNTQEDALVDFIRNVSIEKQKEQNLDIELIQRSWYMEGYHDRKFGNEPKWIIKTGEGGPKYELNPKYGQPLAEEQKSAEFTHHETNESLKDAVTHQMEDDGDVDDFVRKGIDDIVLKYAKLGAKWQKEQKPAEKQDYSGLTELERVIHRGFLCAGVENVPVEIINETAQECIAQMKSAEWFEEDDYVINEVLHWVKTINPASSLFDKMPKEQFIARLKSLRPQLHWKPSEEQIEALECAERWYSDNMGCNIALYQLLCDLKKL